MTTPQPGWYDDPQDAGGQRYFDGQQWTSHRQRKPKSVAETTGVPQARGGVATARLCE